MLDKDSPQKLPQNGASNSKSVTEKGVRELFNTERRKSQSMANHVKIYGTKRIKPQMLSPKRETFLKNLVPVKISVATLYNKATTQNGGETTWV